MIYCWTYWDLILTIFPYHVQKIIYAAFVSKALAFSAHWIELLYVGQISESNKMFVVELAQIPVKVQPPAPVSPELVNQNKQDVNIYVFDMLHVRFD